MPPDFPPRAFLFEEMFKEWAKLKKNKAKHSEGFRLKEKWKVGLEDLFDIAHANALGMTTIQEDKNFLLSKEKKASLL